MKKVLIAIPILFLSFCLFVYVNVRGEKIIKESQREINMIETKIELNMIGLQFGPLEIDALLLNGKKEEAKKRLKEIEDLKKENDILRSKRDSIYINVPGTRVKNI